MVRAAVLALTVALATGAYPLGPFAHVSWEAAFNGTPSFEKKSVQGRAFYALRGTQVGGTPLLAEMALGQVGPQHAWLAAIPLASGGSGQSFAVAVFRAGGSGARYVDSISGSDRMKAQVYDGTLHVTMPARTSNDTGGDCCYAHIRVLDFSFKNDRLLKIADRILPTDEYFRKHRSPVYIAGNIVKLWTNGRRRFAKVSGAYAGTYLIAPDAMLGDVPSSEKLLLVCKGNSSMQAFPYDDWRGWTITAAYPYAGGLR